MPLYEYKCEQCGEEFEEVKSFREKDNAECPKCSAQAKKLISAFSLGGTSSGSTTSGGSCWSGG